MDIDFEVDVEDINRRWSSHDATDVWSQLVLKEPEDRVELLTAAPRTGIWKLADGGDISFSRWGNDWHSLQDDTEGFYLRVLAPGDYRYKGADLGILVSRGRMQTDENELTERCREWIDGVRSQFAGTAVEEDAGPPPKHDALAFKFA
jgi:hypothetical protein